MTGNVRRSSRPPAKRRANGLLPMIVVMGLITLVALLIVRNVVNREPPADRFCEGVYVNGVSLGGMTYEQGVELVQNQVQKRLHEDTYVLRYGDRQWAFTPAAFDASLDLTEQLSLAWNFGHTGTAQEKREQAAYVLENPVHYDAEISYDTAQVDEFLETIKNEIDREPVSAEVTVGEDEFLTISQSQNGVSLTLNNLRRTLQDAIMAGTSLEIELKPQVVEPQYTTEELKANTVLIASYRTSTKESRTARTENIRTALKRFNGVVVQPGETVSFNAVVGKRTVENGFNKSPEYDGTTVIDGIGGGTCQASTTLYGALLKANIDVVRRSSHTMTVSYVKPSLDAAVSPEKDLWFTNYLEYPIYIYTSVDGERAQVNIYGPPCEYDVRLDSQVTAIIEPKGYKTRKDTTGEYVYYTDEEMVEKTAGKNGLKSTGYRVYYDKQTGQEVKRQLLSNDTYYASQPVYWVGVHERGAQDTTDLENQTNG